MFPPDLITAVENKISYSGRLNLPKEVYPSWNDLVPYFDRSFLNGNIRARDPHKIFTVVGNDRDFSFVRHVQVSLGKLLNRAGISCHCYAGFSPNAHASPPHQDPMEVLFVMIQGTMPWKVWENGCDYDNNTKNMTTRSTFSRRLKQGDFVYVPAGVYHVALPDCSRVGFSFGW